jgi:hypothetical protein
MWAKHEGRKVKVDGITCKVKVINYRAKYPLQEIVEKVYVEPTKQAKQTEKYRRMRAEIGDNFYIDLKDCSLELQEDILRQLENHSKIF